MTSFEVGDRVRYIGYNEESRRNFMPSEGVVQTAIGTYGTSVLWETGILPQHYAMPVLMTTNLLELVEPEFTKIIEPSEDIYKDLI